MGQVLSALGGPRRRAIAGVFLLLRATMAHSWTPQDLQPGHWYEVPNSQMEAVFPVPNSPFAGPAGNAKNIMGAWNSGAFDTKRNRLIVWGGGHADYAGNEVYAFDLATLRWLRLDDPSPQTPPDVCYYPDGRPSVPHTYNQVQYSRVLDRFIVLGSSALWGDGGHSCTEVNTYDLDLRRWSPAGTHPNAPSHDVILYATSAEDPATGKLYIVGSSYNLAVFDPATNQWSAQIQQTGIGWNMTAAIDPGRRLMVAAGQSNTSGGGVKTWDLNNPASSVQRVTAGDRTLESAEAPGFVFYPAINKFVGWSGGADVFTLDPDSWTWQRIAPAATNTVVPGPPSDTGTYGRFRYVPDYDLFIVVSRTSENVFLYRFPGTTGTSGGSTGSATPTVTLTASPTTVTSGGSTTLVWSAQNATSCTASGGWTGTKATSGQQAVSNLTTDTSFVLACTGTNGTASAVTLVTVQPSSSGGDSGSGAGGTDSNGTGGDSAGGASSDAQTDWNSRSSGAGVVRALGFDSQQEWLDSMWDSSSCNPAYAPGCRNNAWDSTVKASGAGSVRFDILSQTGEGAAGSLAINFMEDLSEQFGGNEEFWVQWRQRFDDYYINHVYAGMNGYRTDWKQVIIGEGDRRLSDGSTYTAGACSELELVMVRRQPQMYPMMYMTCGEYLGFVDSLAYDSNFTFQNQRLRADGRSSCTTYDGHTYSDTSGCLRYHPNEWMTFMVHVKLGPYGTAFSQFHGRERTGFTNSTVEFYVGRQGGPLELANREENFVIPNSTRNAEYGKIWLLPYMTSKDPSEVHENASTWYDELIISRQPIPAPGGGSSSGGGSTTPTPSLSLSAAATRVNSGESVALSWSSQNVSSCTASGGWSGTRTTSGSATVGPLSETTTFTLTCTGSYGAVARSVTINVASGSGAGSGGSGGIGDAYNILYDPDNHADGINLDGATLSGTQYIYLMPETGIVRVEYYIDDPNRTGSPYHTENFAPYDLGGDMPDEKFDSRLLADGDHLITAVISLSTGGSGTVTASFKVANGSSGGGSTGGGSDAQNQPPLTPSVATPVGAVPLWGYQFDVSTPFADPDGDALAAAHWQISAEPGFATFTLRRTLKTGTALTLSAGTLNPATSYWIRTRHVDAAGSVSSWSSPVEFVTASTAPNDSDGNGTDDRYQVVGFADSNGNGLDDSGEGMCNLLDANTANLVGFSSDAGNIRCFRSVPSQDAPALPDAEMDMPFGLFSFRIDGLPVNVIEPATVSVRVHLPQLPAGTYKWYKLDPADSRLMPYAGGVTISGSTATLSLTDGGPGDFDGTVNGVIVDPSGPVVVPASSSGTGSGGSDSGGSGGSSSGGSSMGLMLLGLLAGAASIRRRFNLVRH